MALNYSTLLPNPVLSEFVRFFWFLEGSQAYTHQSLADVCPELVFHYRGIFKEHLSDHRLEPSFEAGLSAPSERIRKFSIQQSFGIFGAYLYPYTIPHLFRISGKELSNEMVDLKDLVGSIGLELRERIFYSQSKHEMVKLLESFLLNQLKNGMSSLRIFGLIKEWVHHPQAGNVKGMAALSGYSERHLERLFQKYCGLSPKKFLRINRFQQSTKYYGNAPKGLSQIAYDCGYFDQSHFIADFKQFSGVTPKAFFRGKSNVTVWRDA